MFLCHGSLMSIEYTPENLLKLLSSFSKAITDKDIDALLAIDSYISELIKRELLTQEFIAIHKEEMTQLYVLMRESEACIEVLKSEIKTEQSDLKKKVKISKRYLDIERL